MRLAFYTALVNVLLVLGGAHHFLVVGALVCALLATAALPRVLEGSLAWHDIPGYLIGAIAAFYFVNFIWSLLGLGTRKSVDRATQWAIRRRASVDSGPAVLVLRPLDETQVLYYPTKPYTDSNGNEFAGMLPGRPVLPDLELALARLGQPILVGSPERSRLSAVHSAIVVASEESTWRDLVVPLANAAKFVVLVPSSGRSMAEELTWLATFGWWSKTLVFVPPTPEHGANRRYVLDVLASRGLRVPNLPDECGCVFSPVLASGILEPGAPVAICKTTWRSIRKALMIVSASVKSEWLPVSQIAATVLTDRQYGP